MSIRTIRYEDPEAILLPEPIITCWGIWLDTTDYYCKYIQSIRNVFVKLNDDSASILKVINILDDQQSVLRLI
jgi:hypothetical protein